MARNDGPDPTDIDDNAPEAPAQLRAAYERQRARADVADRLERENAALKIGIDTTTRKGQAWLNDYKGALDDPAAMLADATEFDPSIIKAGTPAATATTVIEGDGTGMAAEAGTQGGAPASTGSAERTALADGALPSGAAVQDVQTASMNTAREVISKGGTMEEAIGAFINQRARGKAEENPTLNVAQRV